MCQSPDSGWRGQLEEIIFLSVPRLEKQLCVPIEYHRSENGSIEIKAKGYINRFLIGEEALLKLLERKEEKHQKVNELIDLLISFFIYTNQIEETQIDEWVSSIFFTMNKEK